MIGHRIIYDGDGLSYVKRLKRLFIYTEPEHKSEEFRFPEDPSESSKWGQFAGYEKKSRDEEKNNTNNDEEQAVSNIINTIKKVAKALIIKNIRLIRPMFIINSPVF